MKITPKLMDIAEEYRVFLMEYCKVYREYDNIYDKYYHNSTYAESKKLEPEYERIRKLKDDMYYKKKSYDADLKQRRMFGRVWEYLQEKYGMKYIF